MKYRICRCYSPIIGTWFIVQKKVLFWWKTLPFSFDELEIANQFINVKGDIESLCISPLNFNLSLSEFEKSHNDAKTFVIKVRT